MLLRQVDSIYLRHVHQLATMSRFLSPFPRKQHNITKTKQKNETETKTITNKSNDENRNRFEIEQGLMDGSLAVDDIPAAWTSKMKELLGVDVSGDDAKGCLQDVHWCVRTLPGPHRFCFCDTNTMCSTVHGFDLPRFVRDKLVFLLFFFECLFNRRIDNRTVLTTSLFIV